MEDVRAKQRSLYDHIPPHFIDLSQGTPPDSLLKACVEILKKGTPHMTVNPAESRSPRALQLDQKNVHE